MARPPLSPRRSPRISANDLALYMVSSDTARLGIIGRSKNPTRPPLIRYRDVRPVVRAFLSDDLRRVNRLSEAEAMFVQRADDSATSSLMQDDARNSVEVLHALQRLANQLAPYKFRPAPTRQPKLLLGGVEVSIHADLLVYGRIGKTKASGAAILRLSQDDAESGVAQGRRRHMGLYVATLARCHADQHLSLEAPAHNGLCMSIDVQHGEHFRAPTANTRRMRDLENACRFIAAMWTQV